MTMLDITVPDLVDMLALSALAGGRLPGAVREFLIVEALTKIADEAPPDLSDLALAALSLIESPRPP